LPVYTIIRRYPHVLVVGGESILAVDECHSLIELLKSFEHR